MITRKELLENYSGKSEEQRTELHRKYYAQFVTKGMKESIKQRIGIKRLLESCDEHLNDIPLVIWDSLGSGYKKEVSNRLKEHGDFYSLAGSLCIFKEAAKQLIEEERKGG